MTHWHFCCQLKYICCEFCYFVPEPAFHRLHKLGIAGSQLMDGAIFVAFRTVVFTVFSDILARSHSKLYLLHIPCVLDIRGHGTVSPRPVVSVCAGQRKLVYSGSLLNPAPVFNYVE